MIKNRKIKHITNSAKETQKTGEKLAGQLINNKVNKKAVVVGLEGDMGSGKTTFLQGFAKGLGINDKILSPTFVILKRFAIKRKNRAITIARPSTQRIECSGSKFSNFYHIDCYRLQSSKELIELGFKKIISSPENIIALEWADKIRGILPPEVIFIKFKFIDKNKRQISFAKVLFR